MLNRKIESEIRAYFHSNESKMLIVNGARQIGKSFIIRYIGQDMFPNYIEINLEKDKVGWKNRSMLLRIPVDTRSPIPVISVHSVCNLQYRWQS